MVLTMYRYWPGADLSLAVNEASDLAKTNADTLLTNGQLGSVTAKPGYRAVKPGASSPRTMPGRSATICWPLPAAASGLGRTLASRHWDVVKFSTWWSPMPMRLLWLQGHSDQGALIMDLLWAMVPLSFVLLSIAIWVFFWAVRHGQFDDMDSPAHPHSV